MKKPLSLTLTATQVREAIETLEGQPLPQRTLAWWAAMRIAPPSVRWTRERGRGRKNSCLYNLSDLARVRLIVRLRRSGIAMTQVRAMLAYIDQELREVLHPQTRAELVITGYHAMIVSPDTPNGLEVPSGQFRLPLRDVVTGNEAMARRVQRVA